MCRDATVCAVGAVGWAGSVVAVRWVGSVVRLAGLLLLADSRLPAGGHGHSGGVEALVDRGLLTSTDDLALFLDARLRTAGLVAASFAAAAATLSTAAPGTPVSGGWSQGTPRHTRGWSSWAAAQDARTPSAALREASRAQGAALLRTSGRAWPAYPPLRELAALGRPHQPLVFGAAAAAAGADPGQAAALALHHLAGGAASAAVRLLGLDPLGAAAVQASLAPLADRVAAQACEAAALAVAAADPDLLPSDATPLPEILAELHHTSEVTLFAS
ncbi:MAG: urease accessory protein [Pseudonocardiales bacterium]|nr:urease accessory protein [Pseudonocardiales bacterium]